MTSPWPSGLLTALVTPMKDDEIDISLLPSLVEGQIEAGVNGFVVGGGSGEFGALTVEERQRLAEAAVAAVGGRVPVVIQTGALTTRDAVRLSRHAEQAGANAIMVASPFGEPINWAERLRFYEVVTDAAALPVMIYNTPPSGLLTLEQIHRLAELPHVNAVKDSSGSPELMGDLVEWAAGADVAVYVGLDSLLYDAVHTGARGAVFGAANLIPAPLGAVARSVRDTGGNADSVALWRRIRPLLRFMEESPNYVALCKAGLALQGFAVGDVRAPYLMPAAREVEELRNRLEDVMLAFEQSPLLVGARP
jgi:4-hydroxy-tetrahydrodipicolinate synthase